LKVKFDEMVKGRSE